MESFGPVAPYYDALMAEVPYPMWADYYQLLLAQADASPHRLLDVCCGTGTVAEILCQRDYHVTGVDVSKEMIAIAQTKSLQCPGLLQFHVGDASDFDLGVTFEGAYSFFDSLNYVTDPRAFARAVACVSKHLVDGATFVFDLNTAYAFEQRMFDQRDLKKNSLINYKWKGDYDRESRIIRVDMEFWTEAGRFSEVHVQRAHSHEEVLESCRSAGLVVTSVFESYTLDKPRAKSDRLHYVAVKSRG